MFQKGPFERIALTNPFSDVMELVSGLKRLTYDEGQSWADPQRDSGPNMRELRAYGVVSSLHPRIGEPPPAHQDDATPLSLIGFARLETPA